MNNTFSEKPQWEGEQVKMLSQMDTHNCSENLTQKHTLLNPVVI